MRGTIPGLSHRLRPSWLAAICLSATMGTACVLGSAPAFARGPEGIADVAERVIDAVVNISTSQTIEARGGGDRGVVPQLPPGSPFEEFFDDFFKNHRGPGGGPKGGEKGGDKSGDLQPRKTNSLGSGFIVD